MNADDYERLDRLAVAWLDASPPHQTKEAAHAQERLYLQMYAWWLTLNPAARARRPMVPVLGHLPPPGGTGTR